MSIFSYSVSQQGAAVALSKYTNQVTLIVNTASQCSFAANNIILLNQVQLQNSKAGFTVLAFPCAEFANQEPLSDAELCAWRRNLGILFPVFDRVCVKPPKVDPLFGLLQEHLGRVRWNYTKYLCNRAGTPIQKLGPSCSLPELQAAVERLL